MCQTITSMCFLFPQPIIVSPLLTGNFCSNCSPGTQKVSAITRCPLYSMSAIDRFDCISQENTCVGFFFKKYCRPYPIQVFSCNICENFKSTLFYRTVPVDVSPEFSLCDYRSLYRTSSYIYDGPLH